MFHAKHLVFTSIAGLVAMLAGCSHDAPTNASEPSTSRAEGPVATIDLGKVTEGLVRPVVEGVGTVEFDPRNTRTITAPRGGQVVTVIVSAGEQVSKGDPLVKIGMLPTENPELEQRHVELRYAEDALHRMQALFEQQLATNAEVAQARRDYESALAAWEGVGGEGATTLRADAAGIVTALNVQTGDIVGPGQRALLIGTSDSLRVRCSFEVEDAIHIKPGLPADIRAIFGDGSTSGEVEIVDERADPATQQVGAFIAASPASWLIDGEAVAVQVPTQERSGTRVPLQALTERDGKLGVYRSDAGVAHWVPVHPLAQDRDFVLVSDGLHPGDAVITTGRTSVTDGMAVTQAVPAGAP